MGVKGLTNSFLSVIIKIVKEREENKMTIILTMNCPFCGKEHEVTVTEEQYIMYCAGALAQEAFPNLNATQREQIISHLCPDCQEKFFGF